MSTGVEYRWTCLFHCSRTKTNETDLGFRFSFICLGSRTVGKGKGTRHTGSLAIFSTGTRLVGYKPEIGPK